MDCVKVKLLSEDNFWYLVRAKGKMVWLVPEDGSGYVHDFFDEPLVVHQKEIIASNRESNPREGVLLLLEQYHKPTYIKMHTKERDFSGGDNTNVFHSCYDRGLRWGAIALFEPTNYSLSGVAIETFVEQMEAELYNPLQPTQTFESREKAYEFYERYIL